MWTRTGSQRSSLTVLSAKTPAAAESAATAEALPRHLTQLLRLATAGADPRIMAGLPAMAQLGVIATLRLVLTDLRVVGRLAAVTEIDVVTAGRPVAEPRIVAWLAPMTELGIMAAGRGVADLRIVARLTPVA